MSDKTLLEQWRGLAYDQQADKQKLEKLWKVQVLSTTASMAFSSVLLRRASTL